MSVGYLCRFHHIVHSGVVNAEGDVVAEGVVKEDCLLVHVAYELSEVVNAEVFNIDAVDEHLTLLNIIVARYEVNHS